MSALDARRAKELADLFVEFLRTNSAPEGLFTDDVFLDLSLPRWRLQTAGRDTRRANRAPTADPIASPLMKAAAIVANA